MYAGVARRAAGFITIKVGVGGECWRDSASRWLDVFRHFAMLRHWLPPAPHDRCIKNRRAQPLHRQWFAPNSIWLPVTMSFTGSVFFHWDLGITNCHVAPS